MAKKKRKFDKGLFLAGSTSPFRPGGRWRTINGHPVFIKGEVGNPQVQGKGNKGIGVGKASFTKWKKKVRKEQRINRKIGKAFFGSAGKNIKIGSRYSFDD